MVLFVCAARTGPVVMSVTLESFGENGPAFIDSAVLRARVAVVARPRCRAPGRPTEDGENADTAASDAHMANAATERCTMLSEDCGVPQALMPTGRNAKDALFLLSRTVTFSFSLDFRGRISGSFQG